MLAITPQSWRRHVHIHNSFIPTVHNDTKQRRVKNPHTEKLKHGNVWDLTETIKWLSNLLFFNSGKLSQILWFYFNFECRKMLIFFPLKPKVTFFNCVVQTFCYIILNLLQQTKTDNKQMIKERMITDYSVSRIDEYLRETSGFYSWIVFKMISKHYRMIMK